MIFFLLITFICGSDALSLESVDKVLSVRQSPDPSPSDADPPLGDEQSVDRFQIKANQSLGTKKSAGLLSQIKDDPQAFLAEMQKLDPAAVRNIITLLEELKETSEARETLLVDELSAKNTALGNAAVNVVAKEGVLESANQAAAAANQAVAAAQTDLDNAKNDHTAKQSEKDSAQTTHDDELPSLNNEQQVLTDVIDMLYGLIDETPTQGIDSDWILAERGASCTAACASGCDESRWPTTQAEFEAIYASENLGEQMVCQNFNTGTWTINPAYYPTHSRGCWTISEGSDRCSRSNPDVNRWCPCR